jgi:hypothetical protein
MKASIILITLTALLSTRCKQKGNESNLEGTYSSQARGEYAVANDTLVISPSDADAKLYSIVLKSGFQKIRNGKLLEKEHKQKSWMATWDENKHLLIENEIGRKLHFQPNSETIIWNTLVFKKSKLTLIN